jgi:hypothetical protein
MEHPPPVEVEVEVFIINLPQLLDNTDLIQPLLDLALAGIDRNFDLIFEEAARAWEALEAELRASPEPTEEENNKYAAVVAVIQGIAATGMFLVRQQLLLFQVVGLLLLARVRSRAHIILPLLLAAAAAAVILCVSTGGGVVPGSRSFVRFFILMVCFLFSSNRPRLGG